MGCLRKFTEVGVPTLGVAGEFAVRRVHQAHARVAVPASRTARAASHPSPAGVVLPPPQKTHDCDRADELYHTFAPDANSHV